MFAFFEIYKESNFDTIAIVRFWSFAVRTTTGLNDNEIQIFQDTFHNFTARDKEKN